MRFKSLCFAFALFVGVTQVGTAELIINTKTTTPTESVGQVNSGDSYFDKFTITGSTAFIPNAISVDLLGGVVFGAGPAAVPIVEIYLNNGMFGGPGTILNTSTITSPNVPPSFPYETYLFSGFAQVSLVPGTYYLGIHNLGGPGTGLQVRIATDPVVNTGTSGFVDDDQATLWSLDATPVPEPASLALAAAGSLGMLGFAARRRAVRRVAAA